MDVATTGEALGLLLATDGRPLRHARSFTRAVAGAEVNVAVGLARLGHSVRWTGRVGDDAVGEDVVATLRAEGIDAGGVVVDADAPTGLLLRDQSGDRRVRVMHARAGSAGSRLSPADVAGLLRPDPRLLHLTGITPALGDGPRAAVMALLEDAQARGIPVAFDPNHRPRLWSQDEAAPVLRDIAARARLVLAGWDEARWLTGEETATGMARWFQRRGAEVVVLKRGHLGAWVTDGDSAVEVGAVPVVARDPIGAGDAFDAGFLSGRLLGLPLAACGRRGAACGAACVRESGDLDGLPYPADLEALLAGVTEADR